MDFDAISYVDFRKGLAGISGVKSIKSRAIENRNTSRVDVIQRYRRTMLVAAVTLVVCLGVTVWAWHTNRRQAGERARTRLHQEADRTRMTIRARLELYEDALYGARSLFEGSEVVTRKEFHEYVEQLGITERYPGIQGVGFAQKIEPSQLAAHLRKIRSEGFPNYTVRPVGERSEYTSIVFLEPFDWRNQRAFGFDMFSEPVRRDAMEYARDRATTGLSGKVTLVQETETDVQPGFLMYLPLFRRDAVTQSVEQRRSALLGYVYSAFRARDLMSGLTQENSQLAWLEIYSGSRVSPESLLYQSPELEALGNRYTASFVQLGSLEFGGQTWTLRFVSSPMFDETERESQNQFILPAGIAISLLLFGMILSVSHTDHRALRLADEITARLRESEERVRAITETATDAIISANSHGEIVYFNPAAERIFGYPGNEVIGRPLTKLLPERFHAAQWRRLRRFAQTGRAQFIGTTVEMIAKRANGDEFPASVSLSTWQAGEMVITGILRDITDRKAAESEIIKLNKQLTDAVYRSEKLAITGRLIATIAHEINNPLAALTNLLFVLASDPSLDARTKEYVRLAEDQVALLTNISRQTLAPYRENKFPVATNVSEVLDDVLSMLRTKLLGSRVNVSRRYPPSVELTIYPSELRQVFTNLITNAVDAMPEGGRLTITVTKDEQTVRIAVADTGCGILSEHMERLFEPFFTTKGEGGTGVGLWVVKEIVRKLAGTIDVVSSIDPESHGTTFTISLPAAPPETLRQQPSSAVHA